MKNEGKDKFLRHHACYKIYVRCYIIEPCAIKHYLCENINVVKIDGSAIHISKNEMCTC
jgi:hypothetical protein